MCTRESITSSRSGWSQTQPYRLQDQLHSLEPESGVENKEADDKEKLEMHVFPLGDSCKMC